MKLVISCLLLFLLSSCAQVSWTRVTRVNLIEDKSVTPETKQMIQDFYKESETLFHRNIFAANDSGTRTVTVKYESLEPNLLGLCDCADDNLSCEITLNLEMKKEKKALLVIKSVLLHEIGHSFGLNHSQMRKDIMFDSVNTKKISKITEEELKDFILKLEDF